jgi:NTP pyrophosphatase (non-canonical NTP hydrolase)
MTTQTNKVTLPFNEYQKQALEYRLPSYSAEACVFGLIAETGEVAEVFQKLIRGDFPINEASARLHKELGDVLWHVAQVAFDNGWELEEIADANLEKLASRKLRGQIMGEGDFR